MKIRTLVASSALAMAGISAASAATPTLVAAPVVVTAKAEQAGEVRNGAPAMQRHAREDGGGQLSQASFGERDGVSVQRLGDHLVAGAVGLAVGPGTQGCQQQAHDDG